MEKVNISSKFNKGTVVISVDDGSVEDFRICQDILFPLNVPATFNIITDSIGHESCLNKEQLKVMYNNSLVEIAAHGHTHSNDDEDILKGIDLLNEWLGIPKKDIGFASPYSKMSNDSIRENKEHLKTLGLLYARTDQNRYPNDRHRELITKFKNSGERQFVIDNTPQLTYAFDGMCVNSAVVLHDTNLEDLKRVVDLAEEEKACIVFMFHRISKKGEPKYESTWSYDFDYFKEFAEYIAKKRNNGEIEILTTKEAFLWN